MPRKRTWPLPDRDNVSQHTCEPGNPPPDDIPNDFVVLNADGSDESAWLENGRWFHHGYIEPIMWRPSERRFALEHQHGSDAGCGYPQ